MTRTAVALVASLGLTGCGGGPASRGALEPRSSGASASEPPIAFEAADWIPAGDETVYSYETLDVLSGDKGVLMLRVRRTGGDRAEIAAPKKTTRLVYSSLGVLREAEGTYMLRTPVKEGTSWPVGPNLSATITKVGFPFETPAGSFPSCVEVTERRSGAIAGTITNVYCKGVGLVSVEAKSTTDPPEHAKVTLTKVERATYVGPDGLRKIPAN